MKLYNRLYTKKTFARQFSVYFILSILVISMIGIMVYYTSIGILKEEAEKFHLGQIKSVKSSIDNRFEELKKLNYQISNSRLFNKVIYMRNGIDYTRVNALEFMTMQQELATFKSVNSFIDEIFVYFNNGELILTSTGKDGAEYFFKSMFKADQEGQFNESFLKYNKIGSQIIPNLEFQYLGRKYNSMAYIQGILSSYNKTSSPSNNNYSSSLIILTRTDKINDILGSFSSASTFNINIINNKNEIIGSYGTIPQTKGENDYYSYKGQDIIYRDRVGGIEYIIYHVLSDVEGLEYVAIAPMNVITQKVDQFKQVFIAVFAIAVALTVIMITMATTKSLDPLKKIILSITKDNDYNHSNQMYKTEFEVIEGCINNLRYEKDQMKQDLREYNYLQKNNLIMALIKGNLIYNPKDEIFTKYEVYFPYKYFKVSILEIEHYSSVRGGTNAKKDHYIVPEIILGIKNMVKENYIFSKYIIYVVEVDQNKVSLLINLADPSGNTKSLLKDDLIFSQELKKIKEEIENKFGIIVTVGMGNIYNTFIGINQSYKEAQMALNMKLLKGKSSIIKFKEIDTDSEKKLRYYYPLEKEHELIEGLKSANFDKVNEIFHDIVNENLNKQKLDITTARFLFYDLQATALKALQELSLSVCDNNNVLQDLSTLNTFTEMTGYIRKIYKEICNEIKIKNDNLTETLIKDILNEIDGNFCDSNFSLNICASKFDLSDSYLSKFFREKTGFYFSEYLNRKRIEKAKEYLASEETTVKDIATEVGFISDVTFRRVFKKYELMTPIEYREDSYL